MGVFLVGDYKKTDAGNTNKKASHRVKLVVRIDAYSH